MSGLSMGVITPTKKTTAKTSFELDLGKKEIEDDIEIIELDDGGLVAIEDLVEPSELIAEAGLESILQSQIEVEASLGHADPSASLISMIKSPIPGIFQSSSDSISAILHSNCVGDIDILSHWLMHSPVGNTATIQITSPIVKFHDMLALASIIESSNAEVTVIIGNISTVSELVLVSVCDKSICATQQVISPKSMFDMGVGSKVQKSIEGQLAHLTGLCTHLNNSGILSEDNIEDLLENGNPITISPETLTK